MKRLTIGTLLLPLAGLVGLAHEAEGQTEPAMPMPVPQPPAAGKVTLSVTASGFRGTKGQALFALYATGDTWLKPPKALKLLRASVTGAQAQATFTDLEPGIYAVSVIHDENQNGKLDMHWFPIPGPDEGAGVSNDATATVGPPSFSASRFQLGDRGGAISLKIRY